MNNFQWWKVRMNGQLASFFRPDTLPKTFRIALQLQQRLGSILHPVSPPSRHWTLLSMQLRHLNGQRLATPHLPRSAMQPLPAGREGDSFLLPLAPSVALAHEDAQICRVPRRRSKHCSTTFNNFKKHGDGVRQKTRQVSPKTSLA